MQDVRYKLVKQTTLGVALQSVLSVPTVFDGEVKMIRLTNTTGAPVTVRVCFVPKGASAVLTNAALWDYSIASNSFVEISTQHILLAGTDIYASASSANAVNIFASVSQIIDRKLVMSKAVHILSPATTYELLKVPADADVILTHLHVVDLTAPNSNVSVFYVEPGAVPVQGNAALFNYLFLGHSFVEFLPGQILKAGSSVHVSSVAGATFNCFISAIQY